MTRIKTQVERDFKKVNKDLTEHRSRVLEDFAKAYYIEKNVLPSQIKLVEKQSAGMVEWHFALKEPEVTGIKKYYFLLKFNIRSVKLSIKKLFSKKQPHLLRIQK